MLGVCAVMQDWRQAQLLGYMTCSETPFLVITQLSSFLDLPTGEAS